MPFFKRILASVGIGGAKVDTRLEDSRYFAGNEVRGVVYIQGGSLSSG
jgi:sporulation-control protein